MQRVGVRVSPQQAAIARPAEASVQHPKRLAVPALRRPNEPQRAANGEQLARGLAVAGVAAVLGASLWAWPASAQSVVGMARAVDGDTLVVRRYATSCTAVWVGETRIRLFGIDAPEKAQSCKDAAGRDYACGAAAAEALKARVASGPVRCEVRNTDQYGRTVASCALPSGQDAGEFLVEQGLAVAYRQYSDKYAGLEDKARAAKRGIWAGSFTQPAEWRKQQKAGGAALPQPPSLAALPVPSLSAPPAGPPRPGCGIKGNINASGERIYHVPGGTYYESTVIEVAQGERWFCSEAEAQAAGWRKALR